MRGRPDYGLARIAVDLNESLLQHITINPEKSGVTLDATASAAVDGAVFTDGNGGFRSYLTDAERVVRAARSSAPRPISVIEPASGFPEDVLDSFSDAFEFSVGDDPVAVGWRALARDQSSKSTSKLELCGSMRVFGVICSDVAVSTRLMLRCSRLSSSCW